MRGAARPEQHGTDDTINARRTHSCSRGSMFPMNSVHGSAAIWESALGDPAHTNKHTAHISIRG